MLIGLTYDLKEAYLAQGYEPEAVAELDVPETIEALVQALHALGHVPQRIGNATELAASLLRGERWDLVFNIAEGIHGPGRESLVPALLDHHRVPYTFSDPLVLAVCLHKGVTKQLLRQAGLPTPPFVVVERMGDLTHARELPLPLFIKPVGEGTSRGVDGDSVVRSRRQLESACQRLLDTLGTPVLVETYLPGRELTVGLLGTGPEARALGTLEITLGDGAEPGGYSAYNKQHWERCVQYTVACSQTDAVVREAERLALRAWRVLGARDAGRVDLRLSATGRPELLEVNPLAGLNPSFSDLPILAARLGHPYEWLIEQIVRSASQRVEPRPAAA